MIDEKDLEGLYSKALTNFDNVADDTDIRFLPNNEWIFAELEKKLNKKITSEKQELINKLSERILKEEW